MPIPSPERAPEKLIMVTRMSEHSESGPDLESSALIRYDTLMVRTSRSMTLYMPMKRRKCCLTSAGFELALHMHSTHPDVCSAPPSGVLTQQGGLPVTKCSRTFRSCFLPV